MTITIDGEVDTFDLTMLDFHHAPQCEAVYADGAECENEAKFICSVKCCMGKILLCEECFFGFLEFCKEFEGIGYRCGFCDKKIRLTKDHLKVVGRV